MPLNSQTLEQLGIKELLQRQYQNEIQFQQVMAEKLREVTFKYLKGELDVTDGPAVTQLRDNLYVIGGLKQFVQSQQPNRAWATDVEMTLLAELLGVNLEVRQKLTDKGMVLSAQPSLDKTTFVLTNAHNVHWNPVIEGVEKSAVGDGNCGYNSMALLVKKFSPVPVLIQPQTAVKHTSQRTSGDLNSEAANVALMIKNTEAALVDWVEAREKHDGLMLTLSKEDPVKFKQIKAQIDDDYKLALQLYLDELPGIEGNFSKKRSFMESFLEEKAQIIDDIEAHLRSSGPHP